MSRTRAIDLATSYFDDGQFMRVLDQRVAQRTESQSATSLPALYAYLTQQIVPDLRSARRSGTGFFPVKGYRRSAM